jgi:uncharacterized protein YqeY
LRGLKSSLLYAKVANKTSRDEAMPDEEVVALLAREAKKRQESADLYKQGGSNDRAEAELQEKAIITEYLPTQLSEEELVKLVEATIAAMRAEGPNQIGQVIGKVKQQAGASADGAIVARLVKERLSR